MKKRSIKKLKQGTSLRETTIDTVRGNKTKRERKDTDCGERDRQKQKDRKIES